ncbi:hypothetical protein LEMLEM_LOCUS8699 [Lemmus lemmus]
MRRGSGENLSQGLPSPISSSVSTPASGRSWGGGGGGVLLAVVLLVSPLRNELDT